MALSLIDASDRLKNFYVEATGSVETREDGDYLILDALAEADNGMESNQRRPAEAVLWLHMLLMVWSWGVSCLCCV